MSLGILNARVLTLSDPAVVGSPGMLAAPREGPAAMNLGVLPRASVLIEQDRIAAVYEGEAGAEALARARPVRTIDADGRVLMPGFVDAHTHTCWAGNRLHEWLYQRRGLTYLDVLKAGGGIMATVRAVRAASGDDLSRSLLDRLMRMLREGSTTIEVKSGYGLSLDAELKMLHAIRTAAASFPGTVIPTALLGHAIDPDFPGGADAFVEHLIDTVLPAVSREFPGIAVDAYCESGAWSLDQCIRLFEAAHALGHPIRVHADQFNSMGMIRWAVGAGSGEPGADVRSVDHLEASKPEDLKALASSEQTFGVVLPLCGLHLDDRYANARFFLDSAPTSRLVIASNFNPGSAPCGSMPMVIAIAVRKCGLWPAEAIAAATVNPACLLGLSDRGIIARGARADLVLLRHRDERALAHEFGLSPVQAVVCNGRIVHEDPLG